MRRIAVVSTSIRSVGYENRTLEIEFVSGMVYDYPNVPSYHFENMINNPHPGKYFNANIKPYYQPLDHI